MNKIAVIDYGMSNLHSVVKAFQKVVDKNYSVYVANSEEKLKKASVVILPGQGAVKSCIDSLAINFPNLINTMLNKPFFEICLGFQILFDKSFEDDGVDCLSIIEGEVKCFTSEIRKNLKVPHMGWNQISHNNDHLIWQSIPDETFFYFVHSYFAQACNKGDISSVTKYDIPFTSSVTKENIFACQFHPEKSSKYGLKLIENFIKWSEAEL